MDSIHTDFSLNKISFSQQNTTVLYEQERDDNGATSRQIHGATPFVGHGWGPRTILERFYKNGKLLEAEQGERILI
jgi:hypothetical protein